MSDLLAGLRCISDDAGSPGRIYNGALADVQWRLRNPTDEQVWAIVKATCPPWAQSDLEADLIRAVLAAAAGGDDD